MKNKQIRFITEIGIFSALGIVLDLVSEQVFSVIWPEGGAISLGMIAIFIMAYRHGLKGGLLTGFVIGTLLMISPVAIYRSLVQVLLDYVLAYTAGGLAGIFAFKIRNLEDNKNKSLIYIYIGVFIGIFMRFVFAVISGAFIWYEHLPVKEALSISIIYNLGYLAPSLVVNLLIMTIINYRYYYLINITE